VRVLYSGLLRSPASWARVGREILAALTRLGVEVGALRVRGFLYDPEIPLPEGVEEVTRDEFPADIELTFAHPGLYRRLRCPRRAGILVYEADRLPAAWAEPIRRELDLLLLPSEFCRQGALKAGVPSHLIRPLPFGVDRKVFFPPPEKPKGPFTFLTVASPHRRKGLHELFRAYASAFSASDGVRLIVKTTYDPKERRRRFRWEIPDLAAEAKSCGLERPGGPDYTILAGSVSDRELADLYRKAHVYVQPSYGEGFGLAPLEAAACGCAIITTAWGATVEFFPKEAAYHVGFQLISAAPYEYDRDSGGLMARPRIHELARAMREMRRDRKLFERLRTEALKVASALSWDETGSRLIEHLKEILKRKPRR